MRMSKAPSTCYLPLLRVSLILLLSSLVGCIAPRGNIHSGRVTPRGHFRVGYDSSANLPTNTIALAGKQVVKEIQNATDDEGNYERDDLYDYGKVALAQSLDPFGLSSQFYLRYGVYDHLDLGLAYGSAGFIVDTSYQLLSAAEGALDGALGLQYSSQSFGLPSLAGQAQKLLGFEFSRDDVLLRGVASVPFGEDEKYGAFGFGLALNYTHLNYAFEPEDVTYLIEGEQETLTGVKGNSKGFLAYGAFVNLKVGYIYGYLVLSMSAYYQDYGEYRLPDDRRVQYSGFTFVPSFGIQGAL